MCPSRPLALLPFMALAALSACQLAQAQMVPKAGHALHQNRGGSVTEARLTWLPAGSASTRGQDESLGLDGRRLSSHWEGRMGAMIDRPIDPLHDPLGASHAAPPGLRLRSLHLLSDYYLAGGLRATAGVVGGDTAQAWWGAGERGGGLNLSLQRIEGPAAGLEQGRNPPRAAPYIGAGYSTRLALPGSQTAWQLNADLGLTPQAVSPRLASEGGAPASLDAEVPTRLRHVLKVSVGYAF